MTLSTVITSFRSLASVNSAIVTFDGLSTGVSETPGVQPAIISATNDEQNASFIMPHVRCTRMQFGSSIANEPRPAVSSMREKTTGGCHETSRLLDTVLFGHAIAVRR